MVDIIRLHGDPHKQTQTLLPWYVSGVLEPEETAKVESHLDACAECRADLEYERALGREIADLPTDVERGWAALRNRLDAEPAKSARWGTPRLMLRRPVPLGWALAAQAASLALIALVALLAIPQNRPAYRTLGAPAGAAAGNVVVMFRPTTTEAQLHAALSANAARLVDGPTSADAYVLHVPQSRRAAALKQLRADPQVALAEPIDGDARP
jgi:anti-sigma factor RsiW